MTLFSAYDDFVQRTLGSVRGVWAKLAFVAGLRGNDGKYQHWGMVRTHGPAAEKAMEQAHTETFQTVLETPIPELDGEFGQANGANDLAPENYVPANLNGCSRKHFDYLLGALNLLKRLRSNRRVA